MKSNQNRFISAVSILIILFASSVLFCSALPAASQETALPQVAPLNQEFLDLIQRTPKYGAPKLISSGRALGYFPPPVDLSHMTGKHVVQRAIQIEMGVPPSSYDLRTTGKLTPVKDQGTCGSCWTFGAMGSLESNLLPEEWDFSENNLKNTSGFDLGHCDGGNGFMSMAYLTRWDGPVTEADDPYSVSSDVSPADLTVRKHLQEVLILPARANATDNENIKQAVMTYGAVQTSMYWSDLSYNSTNKAYYYNSGTSTNHAVDIVGWDDTYSKSNFASVPSGDGAFIIRNSWGTSWGMSGYFYISYYDSAVGKYNYVFNGAQAVTNYARVYQYDPLGWVGNVGYSSTTAWFANIFTVAADEQLSAISFYAASPNSPYEIYIYTNASSGPTSGSLAGSTTGTIAVAGYHTIDLPSPVSITSGQKFSVVVKLTTPGFNWPIPYEYPMTDYASMATAGSGQSYISSTGVSWTDITTLEANSNVCLKAFTVNSSPGTIALSSSSYSVDEDSGTVTITATRTGGSTGAVGISYATSNGTATAGSDYTSASGTLSWADGDSDDKTFTVAITSDTLYEIDETFTVTLSGPTGSATLGSPGSATVTINDDDDLSVSYDQFNDYQYTNNWTVSQSGTVSMTSAKSALNVVIAKPLSGCSYADLTSKETFDGENLLVETGVTVKGYGEMLLRLKKDDNNYVEFGIKQFGPDGLPDFIIGSSEDGEYTELALNLSAEYAIKKKYKFKTFSIVKIGDEYSAYLNGLDTGEMVTNALVGDEGLKVELLNGVCSTEPKGMSSSFDYVFVSETIDGSVPASNLTLLAPNGGETITAGSISLVLWERIAGASYYSIDYSVNGGLKWKLLDSGIESNFYTWKLTKEKPNTMYSLRVKAHDDIGTILDWDASDSNFTVQY